MAKQCPSSFWVFPLIVFLLVCIGCHSEGRYEQPAYTVLEKQGDIEIRQYEPTIVAQTVVDASFDDAGNMAFNRLFGYISGKNRTKESIAMTAPVNQQAVSEKIAMTVPVSQQKSGDQWIITFVMPSKYTMQTLPEPTDQRVELKEIPGQKMAAIRYSGTWSKKRYEAHKAKLMEYIQQKNLTVTGEDIFARYDPPFQLFFLRRNEVLIPVE